MFTISYEVREEMRTKYIEAIGRMRNHLRSVAGKNYSVYEVRGRKNAFAEVYVTGTMEEFDALEDNQDEITQSLLQEVEGCLEKGTTKYSTFVEID
jgi:hypothetical protein